MGFEYGTDELDRSDGFRKAADRRAFIFDGGEEIAGGGYVVVYRSANVAWFGLSYAGRCYGNPLAFGFRRFPWRIFHEVDKGLAVISDIYDSLVTNYLKAESRLS